MIIKNNPSPNKIKRLLTFIGLALGIAFAVVVILFLVTRIDYYKVNLFNQTVRVEPGDHFFEDPTIIFLKTPIRAEVRYTLDGSSPDPNSFLYIDPIVIDKTTVITAGMFRSGLQIGENTVHPIFIGTDHRIPVISISMEPDHLWDEDIGIYMTYAVDDGEPRISHPARFKYYEDNNLADIDREIEIQVHGGGSAGLAQKSLRISFDYNSQPPVHYPIFLNGNPEQKHTTLILRNAGGDATQAFMRDALMHRLAQASTAVDTQLVRPAAVYLNGEYWGLYYIRERPDKAYFTNKYDADPDYVTILEVHREQGDESRGKAFIKYSQNTQEESVFNDLFMDFRRCDGCFNYDTFARFADVRNFIDYHVLQFFSGNFDWPYGNYRVWRFRTPTLQPSSSYGLDGLFRWIFFDLDVGLGFGSKTPEEMINAAHHGGHQILIDNYFPFRTAFFNDRFIQEYLIRLADLLNTALSPESIVLELEKLRSEVISEMPRQIERWGKKEYHNPDGVPSTLNEWEYNLELIKVFARHRRDGFIKNTLSQFDLSGTSNINISTNDPEGGTIQFNSLNLNTNQLPWTGQYFNDTIVSIEVKPANGKSHSGWIVSGELVDNESLNVPVNGDISIQVFFE